MNEVKLGTDSSIPWWLNLGLIEEENRKLIRVLEVSAENDEERNKRTIVRFVREESRLRCITKSHGSV